MLLRADSLASTHAIAAALAGLARPGDVIVLAGEMGSGKTAFAQGFGRAIGITEAMTSPTFTLVHSHPCPDGRTTLHHADLYRLDSTSDVDDLALPELAEYGGIVLVEWGDVAAAGLGDHLEVRLRPVDVFDDDEDGDGDGGDDDRGDADVTDGADDDRGDADMTDGADDDFGLDGARTIEVSAVGSAWAGRWDRVTQAVAAWAC